MVTITLSQDDLPPGFWTCVPCTLCGSLAGEECMYNDHRAAHTRHAVRDAAALAAAKERALQVPLGAPVTPPLRRPRAL